MTRVYQLATGGRGLATLAGGAGDRIARAWRRYWQRRAKRATVQLLYSLDDRTLRDIGLSRCEITSVVYGRAGGGKRRDAGGLGAPAFPPLLAPILWRPLFRQTTPKPPLSPPPPPHHLTTPP